MKRSPHELEESIREHVRRKVEASPAMEEEYDRRCYEERGRYPGCEWGCVCVFAAVVGPCVAIIPTGFFEGQLLAGYAPNPSYLALIAHAMFLSAFVLFAGLESIPWGPNKRRLQVLCHFPVGDDEVLRMSWDFGVVWVVAISVPLVTFLPGYVAWSHELSPLGRAVALGLGLLHLPVCFAFATLTAAYFPRTTAPGCAVAVFGVSLVVTALFGPTLARALADPEALSAVKLLFFILPAGWVNGALYYGLLEGHAAGWLLLVPAAVVIAWWLVWKARVARIKEIIFYPAGGADPIFEGDPNLPTAPFRPGSGPLGHPAPDGLDTGEQPPADVQAIRDRIARREFLAPTDWKRFGWIAAFAALGLDGRQRAIFNAHTAGFLWWTRQWKWMLVGLPMMLGLLFVFAPPPKLCGNLITACVLAVGLLAALVASVGGGDLARGPGADGLTYMPVGFHEYSKTLGKVALRRNICWLPLLVPFGLAAAWRQGLSPWDGILCAVLPLMLWLALIPVAVAWVLLPPRGMSHLPLYAAVLVSLEALVSSPNPLWKLATVLLTAVAAFGVWWFEAWPYYRVNLRRISPSKSTRR